MVRENHKRGGYKGLADRIGWCWSTEKERQNWTWKEENAFIL